MQTSSSGLGPDARLDAGISSFRRSEVPEPLQELSSRIPRVLWLWSCVSITKPCMVFSLGADITQCNCGQSGISINTAACPACSYSRCAYCPLQKVRRNMAGQTLSSKEQQELFAGSSEREGDGRGPRVEAAATERRVDGCWHSTSSVCHMGGQEACTENWTPRSCFGPLDYK